MPQKTVTADEVRVHVLEMELKAAKHKIDILEYRLRIYEPEEPETKKEP